MKAGIITFINTINYGAALQAYALQESVEALGIEAEVIQYTNAAIEKKEKNIGFTSVKSLIKKIVMGAGIRNKTRAFQKYEDQNIHRGAKLTPNSVDEVNALYDFFITGSDQVWNMSITQEDWNYFLSFVSNPQKKIAYAPSFGNDIFPEKDYTIASEYIADISALSVREESGQTLIQKIAQKNAAVVLDPTLLLNKKDWENRISFRPQLKHYILVYFPNDKNRVFEFVGRLQQKTNLPVVYLSISPKPQRGVTTIYDASPDEFLGWILYADYVVTGSFHGTAFSLNFEKQFFYEPSGAGSRIDNLVRLTSTEDRRIDNRTVLEYNINYAQVSPKLDDERQKSKRWLKNALKV